MKVDAGGIESITYVGGQDEINGVITNVIVNKYDIETRINGEVNEASSKPLSLLNLLQENLGQKAQCNNGEYIWPIDKLRYIYYNDKQPYFYRFFFKGVYAPGTSSKCLKVIESIDS
ncbi:hypothetical protein [Enterobacter asburiae]|uniref:hypothetical protein n=1 Tax=Enterobacter asburiae TaxID=61645 RepID=UPI002C5ED1E4|nr:hypothetical protein [Enterobacter asburiae]